MLSLLHKGSLLALVGLMAVGCSSKETELLKQKVTQQNIIIKEYEAENRALSQENNINKRRNEELELKNRYLSDQVNTLNMRWQKANKDHQELLASLQNGTTKGVIEWDADAHVYRGNGDIIFMPGESKLSKKGKAAVLKLGNALKNKDVIAEIAGNTDNTPLKRTKKKWLDNFGLSAARALDVLRILKDAGVSEKKLYITGYGQNRPLASNKTKQGRKQNRRVDIYIHPANK